MHAQNWRLLIEVQDRHRFLDKLGISRRLPRVRLPRFNLIVAQPRANGTGRNRVANLVFERPPGQLLSRPSRPRLAVLAGRTTRQGAPLRALHGRERPPSPRARRIVQIVHALPPLPPLPHRVDVASHLPRDCGIRPLRVTMGQQQQLRTLPRDEGCHVTATEVVQPCLLLRCQRDCILGPRAWHLKSPPTLAKGSKPLVCQAFAHRKLATYFVRYVLRAFDRSRTKSSWY